MAKILLVEDDKSLADSYVILLTKEGHEIARAGDGDEALEQAAAFNPDLILLDLLMPKATGLDFLKGYVKNGQKDAKIVVLTNLSMIQAELEAMKLGADKYVVKSSLSPRELAELIRTELG
jgi:DNA-binding response OmpR family regulator